MNYPKAIIKKCEPEVTENEVVIDECRLVDVQSVCLRERYGTIMGCEKLTGTYKGKAFMLDTNYDWVLAKDGTEIVLIPLKKETSK